MARKYIYLEDIGLSRRVPNDLNELLDGAEVKYIEDQVFKKPIRFVKTRTGMGIQLGPKIIFDVFIRIDSKKNRFVVVLDDGLKN